MVSGRTGIFVACTAAHSARSRNLHAIRQPSNDLIGPIILSNITLSISSAMTSSQTSLNQSISAAWSSVPKARAKRTIALNSAGGSNASPSASGSSTTILDDRVLTPVPRKRPRRDQDQLGAKYAPPDLKLSLLGGLKEQITQLLEIVGLPLLHPEIYLHTGVSRPRGVLLHGVPGGGKTQLVRCLAGVSKNTGCRKADGQQLGLPFISVSAPSIVSGMSGESEKTLRDTFDEAKVC